MVAAYGRSPTTSRAREKRNEISAALIAWYAQHAQVIDHAAGTMISSSDTAISAAGAAMAAAAGAATSLVSPIASA